MPTLTTDLESQQDLSLDINGPDGANKLLIFNGTVGIGFLGSGVGEHTKTVLFNVGPPMTREQFRRAIAMASLAKMTISNPRMGNGLASWSIDAVDADWDDETNRIEVRVEVSTRNPHQSTGTIIQRVAYQVSVLAQL